MLTTVLYRTIAICFYCWQKNYSIELATVSLKTIKRPIDYHILSMEKPYRSQKFCRCVFFIIFACIERAAIVIFSNILDTFFAEKAP